MNELYNKGCNWLMEQGDLEVVFSLMEDRELLTLHGKVEEMIKGEVYRRHKFPLCCAGLRAIQATIMFAFWVRKGKGIKVVNGEVVVCELKESPYWLRYQKRENTILPTEMEEVQIEEVIDKEGGEFV